MKRAMKSWITVLLGLTFIGIPSVYAGSAISGNSYVAYVLRADGYRFTDCATFGEDGKLYLYDIEAGTWTGRGPIWSMEFVDLAEGHELEGHGLAVGNLILGQVTDKTDPMNFVLMGIAVSSCSSRSSEDVLGY